MALYELLRPAAELRYAYKLSRSYDVPHPRDSPTVKYGNDGPRILLLGNGPAHGWGVASHELALTGQLAREICEWAPTGCRVDYIGDERMNAATARAWLGNNDLSVYDCAVVVVGINDAVRFTPESSWQRSFGGLLQYLEAELPAHAPIRLAEIGQVTSVGASTSFLGRLATVHARRLNAVLHGLVAGRPSCEVFEIGAPDSRHGSTVGSAALYQDWARVIARHIGPVVTESARRGRRKLTESSGTQWSGLASARELMSASEENALARITAAAREEFNVSVAAVSLHHDERFYYLGRGMPASLPSELAQCKYVLDADAPIVVPDSRQDPRFRDNSLLQLTHSEFYAGHPLYSSSGEAIGAFCIVGGHARKADAAEMDRLRTFALEAQAELWKLEAPRDGGSVDGTLENERQ